jgi:Mn2+/Fe2+ NRAMP family transporter
MIKAPTSFIQRLKFIGPSIIVTGSVVGSGSIALSPLLGAATGFALLWWLLLSLWSKPLIQAEISRYVIATNQTFLESFSDMPGPKTNLKGKKASWLGLVYVYWCDSIRSQAWAVSQVLLQRRGT